ncbi:MAG: hypothetical protein ACPGUV_15485, partial [Polyangiales bacterium]
ALAASCVASVAACTEPQPSGSPPDNLSRTFFDAQVYPVLLRDCSFPACHADPGRFLRIPGPGRTRISDDFGLSEPPAPEELQLAFDRSLSMLASSEDCLDSLFLRKPVEIDAGGASHKGTDASGRDIYANFDDPSFIILRQWACGEVP